MLSLRAVLSTAIVAAIVAACVTASPTLANGVASAWDLPETGGVTAIAAYDNPNSPGIVAAQNGRIVLFMFNGKKRLLTGKHLPKLNSEIGSTEAIRGFEDGPADYAKFNNPRGLAVDKAGNIFVADTDNHLIRHLDLQTKQVTTIAGDPHTTFSRPTNSYLGSLTTYSGDFQDGPADKALFNHPSAVAIDADGNLVIADTHNSCIRYLNLNDRTVSTIAGSAEPGSFRHDDGHADGHPTQAKFSRPRGLAIDSESGAIYVADTGNHLIRRFDRVKQEVTTVAGGSKSEQKSGSVDGPAEQAKFNEPHSLAFGPNRNIVITDSGGSGSVREFNRTTQTVKTITMRVRSDIDQTPTSGLFLARNVVTWPNGALFVSTADNVKLIVSANDPFEDHLLGLLRDVTGKRWERLQTLRHQTNSNSHNLAKALTETQPTATTAPTNHLACLPLDLRKQLQISAVVNSIDEFRVMLALNKVGAECPKEAKRPKRRIPAPSVQQEPF